MFINTFRSSANFEIKIFFLKFNNRLKNLCYTIRPSYNEYKDDNLGITGRREREREGDIEREKTSKDHSLHFGWDEGKTVCSSFLICMLILGL